MSKEFEKLIDAFKIPKSASGGKIIKRKKIKSGQIQELRVWDFGDKSVKKDSLEKTVEADSSEKSEHSKGQFTIEPEFENKTLRKLHVSCSCGNKTEIRFIQENPDEVSEENIDEEPK